MATEEENSIIKDCMEAGPIKVCGVRTFIIALVILVPFAYLAFITKSTELLFAAATMVLTYFFGMKTGEKDKEIADLKAQIAALRIQSSAATIAPIGG
jgi:hypothetical protein